MTNAPLKACPVPGCRARVVRGRCPEHARSSQALADQHRGNFRERGYTAAWSRLSVAYRAAHPLCADPYHGHGEIGAFADVVDHIVPLWAGGALLDEGNLQPLCTACNLRKAAEDGRKYRRG